MTIIEKIDGEIIFTVIDKITGGTLKTVAPYDVSINCGFNRYEHFTFKEYTDAEDFLAVMVGMQASDTMWRYGVYSKESLISKYREKIKPQDDILKEFL